MGYRITTDQARCINCKACEVHCAAWNEVPVGLRLGVHLHVGPEIRDGKPVLRTEFMSCLQCEDARCLAACPTGAVQRRQDGIVRIEENLCVGCRACLLSCPWGVPQFDADRRKMRKCDMCASRLDAGLQPACVEGCTTHALQLERTQEPPHTMVKGARRIDALLERVRMEEIHTVVFHCLEMRQREPTAWERGEVEYGAAFDGPLRDLRKRPEIASMLPAIPQGVLLEGARCARHVLKPKVMERLSAEGVRQVIALCCAMNECVESGKEHGGTHRQEDAGIAIAVVESLSDLQNILKAMAA